MYSKDGTTAYTYTVEEEEVTGYITSVSGYNLINTITGSTDVSGRKTWNVPDGTELPESITVILNRNGMPVDQKTVTANDSWRYEWNDLPLYSEDGTTTYEYTVDEEGVAGYSKKIDGYNLINTKADKTDVSGTKTWNVPDGTELPESITVILKQNGDKYDTKTVSADDNWAYEWNDLPLYSEDGKTAYTYTIEEEEVDGYITSVSGYNLINTITGSTDVSGRKIWNVPEGTELPKSITVVLKQNDVKYDTKTVSADDNWTYEWKDLPLYSKDGKTRSK